MEPLAQQSCITDYGSSDHGCGYCGGDEGFCSHGMQAEKLTVYDYQDLIDGGWRRSGCYIYKPDLEKMCCPAYTIRMRANDFKISKAQKKVARRFERYLSGEEEGDKKRGRVDKAVKETVPDSSFSTVRASLLRSFSDIAKDKGWPVESCPEVSVQQLNKKQANVAQKGTLCTSSFPFPLSAYLKKASPDTLEAGRTPKVLAELLSVRFNDCCDEGYSSYAVKGHINFIREGGMQGIESTAQSCEDSNVPSQSSTQPNMTSLPREENNCSELAFNVHHRKLDIQLVRSSMIEEEYQLYKKYQMLVHGDSESKCGKYQYHRFLVSSPFTYVAKEDDPKAPECGYGAFHMQYRIDGKLIAVGVIDILPRCLSSKYFFWDADYAFLSLGKVSALEEIEYTKRLCAESPHIEYYYMGYYIHDCRKMAYKGDYFPSQLLCPKTLQWVCLSQKVRNALDQTKYCVLKDLSDTPPDCNEGYEDEGEDIDVGDQVIGITGGQISLEEAKEYLDSVGAFEPLEECITQWRKLTGGQGRSIVYRI